MNQRDLTKLSKLKNNMSKSGGKVYEIIIIKKIKSIKWN